MQSLRNLSSSEYVQTELIPEDIKEDEYSIARLKELKVLAREEMLEIDFDKVCSDTE